MMRAWAVLAVIVLSGCLGGDPAADDAGTSLPESEGGGDAAGVERPTWPLGQWWSYSFSDGETRTFIVTEVGDGYRVDVDAEDMAFVDAALSDVSTIGSISADLDGSQDSSSVRFFQWPLTVGDTWDMTWDGAAFTTEVQDDLSVLAVGSNGTRTYALDAEAGWFAYLRAFDGAGGELWSAELVDSGLDYAGTYLRYEIGDSDKVSLDGNARNTAGTLGVSEDATDVWVWADVSCTDPGNIVYSVQPEGPQGTGYLLQTPCPIDMDDVMILDPVPGTWRTAMSAAGVEGTIWVMARTLIEATL